MNDPTIRLGIREPLSLPKPIKEAAKLETAASRGRQSNAKRGNTSRADQLLKKF